MSSSFDHARFSRRALMKCAALAAASPALRAAAPQTVTGLRCEYAVNPLGIDEASPRLSWVVQADAPGWTQSAYQIQVAPKIEQLRTGAAHLWDSGQVRTDQSAHVEYRGKALPARQQCWWMVRVWDQGGKPSAWSEPAYWIMGLPAETDWKGSQWIGHDSTLENTQEKMPNDGVPALPKSKPAPYLRREFAVRGRVRSALLYACGPGYAELQLNGKKIGGESERDPAYTNFDKRVLYVTHDVSALIMPGTNALAAILGTGWYDVHDIATWHFNTAPWRARPVLRLLLALEFEDGRTDFVVSDGAWKSSYGPILRDGIYTGEIYDARREMPGWSAAGFDDSHWQTALIMPGPRGKLVARKCPPVAVTDTFTPMTITEPKPGVFIVDMGRNFSGHTQLRTRAARGTSITMRYAELLNPDGTLNPSNIDIFMAKTQPRQPFQQDTYICKGVGDEVWEQRFSYSGFQYVEVTGFPGKPTGDNFRGRFAHTAMESAGEFSCSNEVLNKIQSATRMSFLSNAQSIPTDCPQREKNGWTGDAQLACETGLMNFRSATFYSKWLDDFADAQRPEGGVPVIVPTGGWGNGEGWPGEVTPPWDAAYPIVAWKLYEYCGDTRILKTHYPNLKKYVDYFAGFEKDGVVPGLGLGDWVPWKAQAPLDFISTAYLYLDVKILSSIAQVIGLHEDAAKYQRLAARIQQGCHSKFYDAQKQTYADGSQTALSMALFFDLAPQELRAPILNKLAADVERQGHLDTGIIGAKCLLRALSEGGRTDLAYRIVAQTEMPGWGYWIKQGATTLWENWKGGSSYNHIMFGDVSNWMIQWLAGISPDPAAPGFQRVLIRPTPVADLTWAKGRHESLHGPIVSEWKKSARNFELTIAIPGNVTATVVLPCGKNDSVTVQPQAARELPATGQNRTFGTGSGRYIFEVTFV